MHPFRPNSTVIVVDREMAETPESVPQPAAKSPQSNSPSFLETPSGRKIAYEQQSGSSPGVVYLHGLCSNMYTLRGERLADYCRTNDVCYLRLDLSGHGRSSESLEQCNITTWLEDVAEVLEMLTQEPQIIVGDGLGGWLMFLYTMRNPERVSGLVGVAPAVDFTQRLWKGLDKDTRKEVVRVGKYPFPSPVGEDPVVLSLDTIVDGEKHSILEMPGKCVRFTFFLLLLIIFFTSQELYALILLAETVIFVSSLKVKGREDFKRNNYEFMRKKLMMMSYLVFISLLEAFR